MSHGSLLFTRTHAHTHIHTQIHCSNVCCGARDAGVKALCDHPWPSLRSLDLSSCGMSPAGKCVVCALLCVHACICMFVCLRVRACMVAHTSLFVVPSLLSSLSTSNRERAGNTQTHTASLIPTGLATLATAPSASTLTTLTCSHSPGVKPDGSLACGAAGVSGGSDTKDVGAVGKGAEYMNRVGQSCIYTLYMTVYLVISLPKKPYIHCTYMVPANPTCMR